ncbi:hypothetical protein [Iningainema tapete]|uniref:Uncharacterized protein n=1 Tax=Iningainema tapete BLCC-T55 TaxID=2748662 RepID=A0A8J7BYJ4_9CYAN|nr:hypothetical protein [Iningainema tapete]MBD2775847.1 hypothetical protein [Iningainema tapete BLCC-T55]
MDKNFTHDYRRFIQQYDIFIQHYTEAAEKIDVINKTNWGGGRNTDKKALLHEQALEAHMDAINKYIQLVAIYRLLIQQWLEANEK